MAKSNTNTNTPHDTSTAVVFYHASCADGFGAAYCAWTQLGDQAEYVPVKYGDVKTLDDVDLLGAIHGRDIYILDFSFPRDVMYYLINTARSLVWLDHHKTAFETWVPDLTVTDKSLIITGTETTYICLDMKRSGALIAWHHFNPTLSAPLMLTHIDDYDRWVFADPQTKAFSKALWAQTPWSFPQWHELMQNTRHNSSDYYKSFVAQGHALLREHDNQVQRATAKSRSCRVGGVEGLAINAPPNLTSDAGHTLALKSQTFGMTYHIDDTLVARCSLRSLGDFDVSALAKQYGGGGHKNAAGFEVPVNTVLKLLTAEEV